MKLAITQKLSKPEKPILGYANFGNLWPTTILCETFVSNCGNVTLNFDIVSHLKPHQTGFEGNKVFRTCNSHVNIALSNSPFSSPYATYIWNNQLDRYSLKNYIGKIISNGLNSFFYYCSLYHISINRKLNRGAYFNTWLILTFCSLFSDTFFKI